MAATPKAVTLTNPAAPAGTPEPLPTQPTEARVEDLASGPTTAAGAEAFAISFAQFQAATQVERDQRAFLDANTSSDMSEDVRDYMYQQFELASAGGGGQIDPALPVLIRSQVTGSEAAPEKVVVELVGSPGKTPSGTSSGYPSIGMQVGVVSEDGTWKVADYAVFRPANAPVPWDKTPPTVKTVRSWVNNEAGWTPLK